MHESLAFTPVPVRARHDGWTPDRQRAFIDRLGELGLVAAAARAVGMAPKSAYRLRDRPDAASFAAAWDAALEEGGRRALDTAIHRALHGTATPVFYRGRQIGERRRYNDGLLIAAIRRLDRTAPSAPFGSSTYPDDAL
ncbi:hypothetical protein GGR88_001069 [Sphingomonas jejuensis]|uniref:Uncharacterized protein n=1 Tax=Sphingomonas jejuensis TaxID=904715 RepID=A0ABX0XK37_9SPHN|nr:hypothetical protein [Sphingomonas jejuensis]NJC33595.1 hypothetical protein [Sphingomonas jejuensis]